MSVEGNAASTYELRGKLSGVFSNIIDNTLSIEGAGADAKATGDSISGVRADLTAHVSDKNNPHGLRAEQVGARPETWTPTALEVGARPDTWTPSASDVGAVPTTRKVNGKALSADITLSAADVGAAPSGYGWGETKTSYNPPYGDPDYVDRTCVFTVSQGNIPIAGIWRGVAHLNFDGAGQMTIRAFTGSAVGCICTRAKIDGAWQPWEWVNPKLADGVEYLTTEKCNGKAVYAMRVNCGTLPNTTAKNVTTTIPSTATIVSAEVVAFGSGGAYSLPMYSSSGTLQAMFFVTSGKNIGINTFANVSAYTGYALVKYTKD